nr:MULTISPECIES: YHS domain-containing (seleno)protein [unclassified Methylobacterium]
MWLTRPDPAARSPACLTSRRTRVLAVCAALMLARPAAGESVGAPIVLLTLNGFDPVSYFLADGPRAGTGRFELTWGGRVWRFASSANREAFRDDPATYAPRLGGYDAAGILEGRLVDADPLVFAVIGNRLYLFRDAGRRARFLADPGLVGQAEAAWPGLRDQPDAASTTSR